MADNDIVQAEFENEGGAIQQGIQDYEARVNVTWGGENGDLPDPVDFQAPDADIRQWVTEAVRGGGVPAIQNGGNANFDDFMIERFAANAERPYNQIMVRPKTPFG
jgi:hypothetical protein